MIASAVALGVAWQALKVAGVALLALLAVNHEYNAGGDVPRWVDVLFAVALPVYVIAALTFCAALWLALLLKWAGA